VQDDQDDWRREASKMGEVYSNAIFTIAADASISATDGCYNKRSWTRDRLWKEVITISSVLSDGRQSRLYILPQVADSLQGIKKIEEFPWIWNSLGGATLNTRGWTYQERPLSPRIIHYGAGQLLWE
jgi:hypothetical protein